MPSPLRHPVALLGACLVAATGLRAVDAPNYETQIRPILQEHCTHCHGEEEKPKGGVDLRLRRFMDGKTEDGSPMLTPGKRGNEIGCEVCEARMVTGHLESHY